MKNQTKQNTNKTNYIQTDGKKKKNLGSTTSDFKWSKIPYVQPNLHA